MEQGIAPSAELYSALIKAQGEFGPIAKNREGQNGNRLFKYADLDELIQKTRPALVANGLAVMQPIQKTSQGHLLVTKLIHSSGASEESVIDLGADYPDVKVYGATLTFMRRYAYQAILCISADDDLDNAPEAPLASAQGKQPSQKQPVDPLFYSQELFDKNLPDWKAAVAAKKTTPERIIQKVESKSHLTDDQRATILSIEVPQA